MIVKFGSWNRVKPPHELPVMQNGVIQCSVLQNYVVRDGRIRKIGGTQQYNATALDYPITWIKRSYHKLGDGSFVKRTLCFSGGTIYSGDDATGEFTSRQGGFKLEAIPLSVTMQVAGNSILFFFTGYDTPYKYDGNGSYIFEKTSLSSSYQQGLVHLQRMWYVTRNSSTLDYSETLKPETIEDQITFGSDKDSFIRRIVLGANETMYVFKNNSIWQLYGRTSSTFQTRIITDKYGLASKRAIYPVGSGFIFLNEFDKELYFFGGSEASIRPLTEDDIKLREIIDWTKVDNVCMVVHDGLFRFAFQYNSADQIYNNHELVYPLNEPDYRGLPKWSLIKGTRVLCYSVWNQQGDKNELVTGRSDTGKMMYHNRTNDFDGEAVETIARTGEIVASEDKAVRFKGFWVKAHPGSHSVNALFRYYLNGRYSERGEHSLSMKGETRQVGTIHIQKSYLFNDRIVPFVKYSRGNSISFEVYDFNTGTEMELYSVAFQAYPRFEIRNQHV